MRAEAMLPRELRHGHAGFGLLDEPDDLFGGEATLAHVRPLWVTDFTQECVVRLNGGRSPSPRSRTSAWSRKPFGFGRTIIGFNADDVLGIAALSPTYAGCM
jgi:hypothetical protein